MHNAQLSLRRKDCLMVRVTALMENNPSEHKLLKNEHGLSFYIETPDIRLLFDCGGSENTIYNAHRLGISLKKLDAVVISHSHYDHAAGYRSLIEAGLGSDVLYTGPNFFEKKYATDGVKYTDLSAGFDLQFLHDHKINNVITSGLTKLSKHIYVISGFVRKYDFEKIQDRFVRLTKNGFIKDDFIDEQSLVIEHDNNLIVFVGCSHPGILNMLTHIHNVFEKPIEAVYGGTHLVEADEERIQQTLSVLTELGVTTCGFCHCTGKFAEDIAKKYGGIFTCHLACGDTIFFK